MFASFLSNLPALKERCESQRLLGQGSQRQEAKGSEKSRLIESKYRKFLQKVFFKDFAIVYLP